MNRTRDAILHWLAVLVLAAAAWLGLFWVDTHLDLVAHLVLAALLLMAIIAGVEALVRER